METCLWNQQLEVEMVVGVPADFCGVQQQEIALPENPRLVVVHDDTKELDVGGETVKGRDDRHHVHILVVVTAMLVEDPIAALSPPERLWEPIVTENAICALLLAIRTTHWRLHRTRQ